MTSQNGLLRAVVEGTPEYQKTVFELSRRGETDLGAVEDTVQAIIADVRRGGDAALLRLVERYERRTPAELLSRNYAGAEALSSLSPERSQAFTRAAKRIERYHREQAARLGAFEFEELGVTLANRVTPLHRVGIYAPGGKASYPSTVLMCAVIAKVAQVSEVILACPDVTTEVRAACHLSRVDAILHAGGAQAIAALAYGTETIPQVDKIVGPGNLYVAAAKRAVFGQVDIDSIAGPSEILVIADEAAVPSYVAADLLSQAEHDEAAYPLLLTTSQKLVNLVCAELERQLQRLPDRDDSGRPRRAIAERALADHGVALIVNDRSALGRVATELAAEHVSVQTRTPRQLAFEVRRAGAIFIGPSTPEAAGDYLAGPSHVLPTGGAARYGAPLGVYDFVSRSSIIEYSPSALREQANDIAAFARSEGLEAHARAVEVRASSQENYELVEIAKNK